MLIGGDFDKTDLFLKNQTGDVKMGEGIYDLDGKCTRCKQYHPCDCEAEHWDCFDKETQGFDVPDEFDW